MDLPRELRGAPFTVRQAEAAGLTRSVLRGRRFRRVLRDVYVPADWPDSQGTLVRAALAALPSGSIITGVTGLQIRGVDVGPSLPLRFCSRTAQVRRADIEVRRVSTLPPRRGALAGVEHCFVTAALHLDLLELVTAGDWLVRLGLASPQSLMDYAESTSVRGCRPGRRAARLVRRRVDSPRETRLRLCLVLAGLPEPECNVTLGTETYPIGKVDLVYQRYKIILEYEGDQHRTDRRQWNIDIGRSEAFGDEGYVIIRVTAERMRYPRTLVERVYEALVARGYRGPQPTYPSEWVDLFDDAGHSVVTTGG